MELTLYWEILIVFVGGAGGVYVLKQVLWEGSRYFKFHQSVCQSNLTCVRVPVRDVCRDAAVVGARGMIRDPTAWQSLTEQ